MEEAESDEINNRIVETEKYFNDICHEREDAKESDGHVSFIKIFYSTLSLKINVLKIMLKTLKIFSHYICYKLLKICSLKIGGF